MSDLISRSEEEWKDIQGYEGLYQVSNLGNVKSLLNNRLLKPGKHSKGYLVVILCKNKKHKPFYVHRLVAQTFLENKDKCNQVNHIDGDKSNNNVCNLEWCNDYENKCHAYKNGLRKAEDVIEVEMCSMDGVVLKRFTSIMEAHRESGVNKGNISRCVKGKCKTAGGYIFRKVG